MKNNETNKIKWDKEIMQQCKILYAQNSKPMTETCMCWGFECSEGWKAPLQKLSFKLEEFNLLYYPKYNVRIQADQVKEKYGTLRYYYSVRIDPNKFTRTLTAPVRLCVKLLNNINYKVILVDSKYIPKKHKILYKINNYLHYIIPRISSKISKRQFFIANSLNIIVEELVNLAEKECNNTCQDCGNYIGENSFYKKCVTVGWISYICQPCAEKSEKVYQMEDGKQYRGTNLWTNPTQQKN